jgi:alkaline phosphatase D
MKNILSLFILFLLFSCKQISSEKHLGEDNTENKKTEQIDFTIVFASCNDQDMKQPLWKPIIETKSDVFIWGGDNIYADTDDMNKMEAEYQKIKTNPNYVKLASMTQIIGTWDDHDYGKNDAGVDWKMKAEAQQLFLDFIDVPDNDIRRSREGVYHSQTFTADSGSIKIILLDTRYFRSPLQKSPIKGIRYKAWEKGTGETILGETQWEWLSRELEDNTSTFTIIISSIQFLADENGWEKWGNFPDEVKKMYQTLKNAKANNIFILSGDRHLAEFSVAEVEGLNYPLIDFTTSGMTKTYPNSPYEPNRYRVGNQVKQLNFGLLGFDFKNKKVKMEIRGANNYVFDVMEQEY